MPDINQQVRTWLLEQKDWLQLAADLGISKLWELDTNDIKAIADHLKTAEGQKVTKGRTFDNLGADPGGNPIRLQSVGDIIGIENLGPRTPLDFGVGNLCVVYGNNGSGKSSYTRLLKKAAGKPGAKDLKSNVFKPAPGQRQCKIRFHDGINQSVDWPANDPAIAALRSVDIFDSEVATAYLSKESESSYTPPLVSLFERLAFVVTKVKEHLLGEQAALVKTLPIIPAEYATTKAGEQYNDLNEKSSAAEVNAINSWSAEEENALSDINERLTANDPAALALRKRATQVQIEQIANHINTAVTTYTAEKLEDVRKKRQDMLTKRQIAVQAGQVASAKLEGIGTDTWKAMWEAARQYSQLPFPKSEFPVVSNDARCLLCHQELSDEAKHRLQDFETFVQGDVEAAATSAENTYTSVLSELTLAQDEAVLVQACQAAGLIDEALIEGIKSFWRDITACRKIVQADTELITAIPVAAPTAVIAALQARISELVQQANQHDLDAANFNRVEAAQQKKDLEAKKWTSQQSAAINTEINRLKKSSEFNKWIKTASTTAITTKGGQLAEATITEAYITRFNSELNKLGATNIKVKLTKTKAVKGRTFHAIQLEGATVRPEDILSEGERRIISLAAFLADVAETPNASTFIFDDPISSLDQKFETNVANRLVQLAKSRQVLVFTHRTSLLVALEDASDKLGKDPNPPHKEWKLQHLHKRWITSFNGVSGETESESVSNASSTIDAIKALEKNVSNAKIIGKDNGIDAYSAVATGLCRDMRILLERMIEEDLLNKVVLRQRRSVTTDNRLATLPNITLQDCQKFDNFMTKYSTLVHSQSMDNPIELPSADDIKADLDALHLWRAEFKKRPTPGVAHA